jgi:hypothetical protein
MRLLGLSGLLAFTFEQYLYDLPTSGDKINPNSHGDQGYEGIDPERRSRSLVIVHELDRREYTCDDAGYGVGAHRKT